MALLLSTVLLANAPFAMNRYPDSVWLQYSSPEDAGFVPSRVDKVKKLYEENAFSALLVIKDGAIAIDWGENERRFPIHSIRKSILSALYGKHSSAIDFEASLKALNFNDNSMLTEEELSATLFDLISSRSGVYLPAAAESNEMASNKPVRGSHKPGSYWWYNNWDFNAAGALFSQITGEEILESIQTHLATPLQMQDYRITDGYYVKATSEHPAFQINMSSRDLARFGLLYAKYGVWKGDQLIPRQWIVQSTSAINRTYMSGKHPPYYGLMWWVEEDGSFSARGSGGHTLAVYPSLNLVVVLRVDTFLEQSVAIKTIKKILAGIVSASEGQRNPNQSLVKATQRLPQVNTVPSKYQFKTQYISLDNLPPIRVSFLNGKLFVDWGEGMLETRHLQNDRFVILDRKEPLVIELSDKGAIIDIKTPRLFFIRAANAAKKGSLAEAQLWVEQAVELNPSSPIPYISLAKIQLARGNKADAKETIRIALALAPDNRQAKKLYQGLLIKQYAMPALLAFLLLVLGVFLKVIKAKI